MIDLLKNEDFPGDMEQNLISYLRTICDYEKEYGVKINLVNK